MTAAPSSGGFHSLAPRLLWSLPLLAVLLFILTPNFLKARSRGFSHRCAAALRDLAAATERFASDHSHCPPRHPGQLVSGHYLGSLPRCSVSGRDYLYRVEGSKFSLVCPSHHPGYPPGFPRYDSLLGLQLYPWPPP